MSNKLVYKILFQDILTSKQLHILKNLDRLVNCLIISDLEGALRFAAKQGHIELVKQLVENNVNIHIKHNYALRMSAKHGHLTVMNYLVSKGANIEEAIKYSKSKKAKNILTKYRRRTIYKGILNDQTERDCGICLTEMNTEKEIRGDVK